MVKALVKNWSSFQHYKDRRPPWVKLHHAILDDYAFGCLPLASKALAPCIWLLASESEDGSFDADPDVLAFRLHWSRADIDAGLSALFEKGFIVNASKGASKPRALRKRHATPETETETETERSKASEPIGSGASTAVDAPPCRSPSVPYQAILDAYNRELVNLPKVRELTRKRRTAMRIAWQSSAERQTVGFWIAYFEECADDPFLSGRGPYQNGHENWRPSFDYLIREDVVVRVAERAMDRAERRGIAV